LTVARLWSVGRSNRLSNAVDSRGSWEKKFGSHLDEMVCP
jgi:hypothetical protein